MEVSNNCINLIKQFEGFRPQAYLDIVQVPTLGYGSTRWNGRKVTLGMKCTEAEATEQLMREIRAFEEAVKPLITVSLKQSQYDAILCFVYNVGAGAFAKSTMLKKLNAGNFTGAAEEFLRWNRAGGVVVPGLARRRAAEKALFESV